MDEFKKKKTSWVFKISNILLCENFDKLWLWYEKNWNTLMFYPFENIKNPITIALSSYFHIYLRKELDKYFLIFVFLKIYLNAY
jgi:hypothetical protein